MSKQYLYVGTSGYYFVDSDDTMEKMHKGIRLVGEVNEIITDRLEFKCSLEAANKSNGDLRAEVAELKEAYSKLEFQFRQRLHG